MSKAAEEDEKVGVPVTRSQDQVAPDDARSGDHGDPGDLVSLQVMLRSEHASLLQSFANREGATAEALASLWLEEKLDEALRSSRAARHGPTNGR